jgi:hypothetical protein
MTQDVTPIAEGFDIGTLDSKEDVLFTVAVITDVDGNDKSGFYISSKNSEEYQAATHRVRVDSLKRSAKRKAAVDTTTEEGATAIARVIEGNEMTLACAAVKGWFGFTSNGAEVPFSKTTLVKMLTRYPTWKDKITIALENEANFTKG